MAHKALNIYYLTLHNTSFLIPDSRIGPCPQGLSLHLLTVLSILASSSLMVSCPGSKHHVYRCLAQEGTELLPQVSLFYQKGRSFPEDPSLPPSAPIGWNTVTWASCKGGWERIGWCFQTLCRRGGGITCRADICLHLLTGNFLLSQSFL